MDDQRKFHWFVAFEFDLANFVEGAELVPVDQLELNYGQPENQLNILTEIEKAEEEAELVEAIEEREEAEKDVLFYEDPAGNTFEAPVVKVEPELELPSFDEIVFQGLRDMDKSLAEKKALEEALEVEAVKPAEAEELIQLQEKLDKREIEVIARNILEDDDFNFNLDDTDDDTLGGEFFL
jgi:hypothetical protein